MLSEIVSVRLKDLPKTPGVYFHKSADGEIIYVGKAARLNNRVRQYFQKSRARDPKTEALVAEIADLEWIEVASEIDALFLEAEMIRRYMPRYNILLRDDKSLSFVRIDHKADIPTLSFTRRPLDDGAEYIGPFVSGYAVRKALRYLRRIFPYYVTASRSTSLLRKSKLPEQIGVVPRLDNPEDLQKYRRNLKLLSKYMRGQKDDIKRQLERDMKTAAKAKNFEEAAIIRNRLLSMKGLENQIIFSDREILDISKDQGLSGLAELLGLEKIPSKIEGYDISHMSGKDTVASMVVFSQGMPDKAAYRKFKMRIPGNDDFVHMREVILRRLSQKNIDSWGIPDLFLIDGGKGQLAAAIAAQQASLLPVPDIPGSLPGSEIAPEVTTGVQGDSLEAKKKRSGWVPMIGLAKKEEEIVVAKGAGSSFGEGVEAKRYEDIKAQAQKMRAIVRESEEFLMIELPKEAHVVKLLQRIRDESHRFAVSYHSTLKRNRQTTSWLDEVPGIGPTTRKKLIREFGSARGVVQARDFELQKVLGDKKAVILRQYIRAHKKHGV